MAALVENLSFDVHHLLATYDVSEVSQSNAVAATQGLVNELFALPVERSNDGPIATLPLASIALPRAKPAPKPKEETKWEAFARTKGIQKRKKGRMGWNEDEEKWAPNWGYKRLENESADEPIIEVKGDDVMVDPRKARVDAKKERVAKNERQRKGNEKRRGVVPAGVPRDARGKDGVEDALSAAQVSTASLGKFDARRQGEKPRKEPRGKKRSFAPVVGGNDLQRSLAMLHDLSQPRAKAPKKGHAETMDTHDGERPNSDATKRKKGRGASGKMKKMTKKRAQ